VWYFDLAAQQLPVKVVAVYSAFHANFTNTSRGRVKSDINYTMMLFASSSFKPHHPMASKNEGTYWNSNGVGYRDNSFVEN
jgi:hypothetical protein